VLIHDFVQVARPYGEIVAAILANPKALFGPSADAAYREGERLSMRLTPLPAHPSLGKRIEVDVGSAYRRSDRLVLPINWWATGATVLFPRLDADLEIAPMGDDATQITLMGRYDPPFSVLGDAADRLLLHRVAEASVRAFLTGVAAMLSGAGSLVLSAV